MYVAKVKLDNVRGFHDARRVDLGFARPEPYADPEAGPYPGWTVLVGPDGAGKTTLLRAIALALAGPGVAPGLMGPAGRWLSLDKERGGIEVDLRVDALDGFAKGVERPAADVFADLTFTAEGLAAESNVGRAGPWQDSPVGWFGAGYGAYRRLGAGVPPPQSRVAGRLAGLFRDDVSLADSLAWLAGQRAAGVRDAAMAVLTDAMFPGEEQISRLDGDGLWVGRLPVRELGEAHRAVTALVVDLLRQLHTAFGELTLDPHAPAVTAPGVVLIDEAEAHLHPRWQQHFGEWLKRHFPRVQFIVTTDSPHICQSADPGGLIHVPPPQEQRPPYVVGGDLYQRVVFGSGEDILLSGLFGLDSPYSAPARRMRRELVELELKVLDGSASDSQAARYQELQELLVSSPTTRAREMEALLRKERVRRGTQ